MNSKPSRYNSYSGACTHCKGGTQGKTAYRATRKPAHSSSNHTRAQHSHKRCRNRRPILLLIIVLLLIACAVTFICLRYSGQAVQDSSNQSSSDTLIAQVAADKSQTLVSSDERLKVSDSANLEKSDRRVVYLTFDDGPSGNTDRILSILNEYGVNATWFIKGNSSSIAKVKDIWQAGNQLAVHTYTHEYTSIYKSESAFWQDINQTYDVMKSQLGFEPAKLLRFPGGSFNAYNKSIADRLTDSVGERGWHYFDWNVSCGDGATHTADELYGYVVSEATGASTACVLMHDSDAKDTTVEALPRIIQWFKDNNYEFNVIVADTYGYHF